MKLENGITIKYFQTGAIELDEIDPSVWQSPEFTQCLRGTEVQNPDYTGLLFTASRIDSTDKYTEEAGNCLIAVHIGQAPNGDTLSFIAHLTPRSVSSSGVIDAYSDLLSDLAARTERTTRGVIIAGDTVTQPQERAEYTKNLGALKAIHIKVLQADTYTLAPKKYSGITNAYLLTSLRQLNFIETGFTGLSAGLHESKPQMQG